MFNKSDEMPYLQLHDVRFYLVLKFPRICVIFRVKSVHPAKHNIIHHCILRVLQVSSYEKLKLIFDMLIKFFLVCPVLYITKHYIFKLWTLLSCDFKCLPFSSVDCPGHKR